MTATRLNSRAIIRLEPATPQEDASAFLQGLVTNDVTQARADAPVYAALLSAQGKMAFDFFIYPSQTANGAGFLIDCEKDAAADLVKRLSLYRLRRAISIALDEAGEVHWSKETGGNDPRLPALGRRSIMTGEQQQAGQGADDAYLAHRLSLGVPEGRTEMGDILWLETNAAELNGVSFTKGCYVGQENTARMNWRQKINRRLVVVRLDASIEKRRKAEYSALGLAVDHLRVADIAPEYVPDWLNLEGEDGGAQ